ncbi:hypothetical protein B484DRAFT_229703 [Ochromonadaceae sp. CCMP2298]|nr:hypothetical protein B484DRAFT_229703 [Ochromonadaceae sp. CCMP2298]
MQLPLPLYPCKPLTLTASLLLSSLSSLFTHAAAIRTVRRQGQLIEAEDFEEALRAYVSSRGIGFPSEYCALYTVHCTVLPLLPSAACTCICLSVCLLVCWSVCLARR